MTPARAIAGLCALGLVLIGANLRGVELNQLFLAFPGIDKILHSVAYAFAFICFHGASSFFVKRPGQRIALAAAAGITLSLADELLQQLAPGRSVDPYDVVADWAGLTLGWVVAVRPAPRLAAAACIVALGTVGFVAHDTYAALIDYSHALRAERQHDFATARVHYQRAMAKGNRTADVYNGFAWVTLESDSDPQEALTYARKALDMQPGNADILDTYGWALQRAGRSGEALPFLHQAYALKPEMYCIHYHLGQAYVGVGKIDKAEWHLRRQTELPGTREAGLAQDALAKLQVIAPQSSLSRPSGDVR
jgi:tetratricopeptide (TPR) repeat protein